MVVVVAEAKPSKEKLKCQRERRERSCCEGGRRRRKANGEGGEEGTAREEEEEEKGMANESERTEGTRGRKRGNPKKGDTNTVVSGNRVCMWDTNTVPTNNCVCILLQNNF